MNLNLMSSEEYNLDKLSTYLNYELSSSLLLFLWYMWGFTLFLAVLAPVLFIPYMLYVFYEEKEVAWFLSFCCIVFIPAIILAIVGSGTDYFTAFLLIPLGLFYIYCTILRYLVNNRLNEIRTQKYFKDDKFEKEQWLIEAKDKLS